MANVENLKEPAQVLRDLLQSSEANDIKYIAVLYRTKSSSQLVVKSYQDQIIVQGLIHEAGRAIDRYIDMTSQGITNDSA